MLGAGWRSQCTQKKCTYQARNDRSQGAENNGRLYVRGTIACAGVTKASWPVIAAGAKAPCQF